MSIGFDSVGVICHNHEEQITKNGFTKAFRLTRNPIDKDGSTAAIVEEGRIHMDITLIFGVSGEVVLAADDARRTTAYAVTNAIEQMRVAGGTVIPRRAQSHATPYLTPITQNDAAKQFRDLRRRWLPGFALTGRDDLLSQRLQTLRTNTPSADTLDAWLDLSRLHWKPQHPATESDSGARVEWHIESDKGWIVPIPVGYGELSQYPAGTVKNTRDPHTPFSFVESIYTVGEWVSPHRLHSWQELMWYGQTDTNTGLYRAYNDYASLASNSTFN
jgi:CRISPR-associated protein Csy2